MKNAAIIGLAAASLLLASNADANADTATDTYLNDMAAAGFSNNSGNPAEIRLGMAICGDIANGTSEGAEAHSLWVGSQLPSIDVAHQMVSIAVDDLCPGAG